MEPFSISMSRAERKALRRLAAEREQSVSAVIRHVMQGAIAPYMRPEDKATDTQAAA